MGLDGYRSYKQHYIDNGEELESPEKVLQGTVFQPNFRNHNTIQIWELVPKAIGSGGAYLIGPWQGDTLADRSLHEITVVNTTSEIIEVRFVRVYMLVDERIKFDPGTSASMDYEPIFIGPKGKAHYYTTGINIDNNITMQMRTGTQDDRNI